MIFTRAAAPQDQLQSSSSSRRPECISEGGGASARASVTAELPNMQITDNQPIHPKVRPFSICDPSVERLLRRHYRVTSDWLASCVMGGAELTVVCNKVSTLMNLTSDLQQKTVVQRFSLKFNVKRCRLTLSLCTCVSCSAVVCCILTVAIATC